MTLREFITALPKVELNLQLTGALRKDSLMLIASQNGISSRLDDFADWARLLDAPDPARHDEIASVAGGWIMYPEDIALVVYDIGVALSKQNVRYAEVAVAPSDFVGGGRMNFDVFLAALNDGRDRAYRAWNVELSWILCIPRDNPRAGDDVARWATGSAARRGHVVAMGLTGSEETQPAGQFKRAFATARKKELVTAASAGDSLGAAGIRAAIDELRPDRLVDVWPIADDDDLLAQAAAEELPAMLSANQALVAGLAKKASDLPLPRLLESGLPIALSCDKPSLYQSDLVDEYLLAHESWQLSVDQLCQLARASIKLSFLDAERKASMLRSFDFEANAARARFLNRD